MEARQQIASDAVSDPATKSSATRSQAAPARNTTRLYAADWADFSQWCRTHARTALPATANTLAEYLLHVTGRAGAATAARRRSAIAAAHRAQSTAPPKLDAAARKLLRAARLSKQSTGRAATARRLTEPAFLRAALLCPGDLAGQRDRALLLLAIDLARSSSARDWPDAAIEEGASGKKTGHKRPPRGALLNLDAEALRFVAGGVELAFRTRLGDDHPSRTVLIGRNQSMSACPVRALEDWLRASETLFGPVFRRIDRWGNVEHTRLGPDAFVRIVRRRAGRPPAPRRVADAAR